MPWTVTPAGASIVKTVGMKVGSRGLSDCTCSPSGSLAWTASRIVEPGWAPLASTMGVSVARGRRSCACAVGTARAVSTPKTQAVTAARIAGRANRMVMVLSKPFTVPIRCRGVSTTVTVGGSGAGGGEILRHGSSFDAPGASGFKDRGLQDTPGAFPTCPTPPDLP